MSGGKGRAKQSWNDGKHGQRGHHDQHGQVVTRDHFSHPAVGGFTCPEYEQRFEQYRGYLSNHPAKVFYGMPPAAREEAERRTLDVAMSIRAQYELEQDDCWVKKAGVPRKNPDGWGSLHPSLQTAQHRGAFEQGSFEDQAFNQMRVNANVARHAPFNLPRNQPGSIQGQSLLALLPPGGAAESHGHPSSSRFERQY
jgi:hypothetical protein